MIGKHNGNRKRVAAMTAQGLPPKQIAEKLGITIHTVYTHIHHIRKRSSVPPVLMSASGGGYQETKPPLGGQSGPSQN